MNAPLSRLALLAAFGTILAGCASVNSGLQSMTAKLEAHNANRVAGDMGAFPDQTLRAAYVLDNGRPAPTFACSPCSLDVKSPDEQFDFLLIDRRVPPVNDALELATINTRTPIETTDVGQAFVRTAQARGNYVAVYGAPVNNAILKGLRIPQFFRENVSYPTDLSACLIEVDRGGAFVSILAVGYELSQGVVVSDFPGSKDVFVNQRVFLFPASTSRFVQERLASRFTEDYRVR